MSDEHQSGEHQEFFDLCRRYVELYGELGTDDYWKMARLGERGKIGETGGDLSLGPVRILSVAGSNQLFVEYEAIVDGLFRVYPIWSNQMGFSDDIKWRAVLQDLRRVLVLDAIVTGLTK
ncbi:MAG: hypothetical protein AB7L09_01725 [Nitrospira sp.]